MIKMTPALAEALANLRGNRDFETVLKGIQEHIAMSTRQCIDGEGSVQLRAAGATKALECWVKAFVDAPASLDKLRNPNR